MSVRVRFAPSPTGFLHLGSARTALFNWLWARHVGGEMLLRIEDTDRERSQPELIEVIFDALRWLGIDWDGEATYQSDSADRHAAVVEQFLADGTAYRCDCTQEEVQARVKAAGGPPGYDGYCRDREVPADVAHVVRFRVPDDGETAWDDLVRGTISFEHRNLEDFVLRRRDGTPMFIVANAVDDADSAVTHVIRGEDLINVTPKQLLLRQALGFTQPLELGHMPLIVNEQRKKLSKRRDDVSLLDYRDRGFLPEAMVNYLALLGWGLPDGSEIRLDPLRELPPLFDIRDVNDSSAFFDTKKLRFVNGEDLRALPVTEFAERSQPYFDAQPWADRFHAGTFGRMAAEVQTRVETLSEVPGYVDFLFLEDPEIDEASWTKAMVPDAPAWLDAVIAAAQDWPWEAALLHERTFALCEEVGASRKKFQAPIRVAITGRSVGPPLFESMEVLGRDEVLRRLRSARERLGDGT